jgi:hypothetical protein
MSSNIEMDDLSQFGKRGSSAGAAKDDNAGTTEQDSIDIAIDRLDGSVSFWAWASAAGLVTICMTRLHMAETFYNTALQHSPYVC